MYKFLFFLIVLVIILINIFSGVAAKSLAAAAQSVFYKGSTTGVFLFLQSAGASGFSTTANAVLGGSTSIITGYVQGQSSNPVDYKLSLNVYAFYRIGSKYEDLADISNYLKDNFALDVEVMPFIPVCCDDKMRISVNQITCDDLDTIVAPGCLVSIQTQRNWLKQWISWQKKFPLIFKIG